MRRAACLMLAVALVSGCASAGEGSRRSSSRGVITAAEIEAAGPQIQTAYEAVEQLRPQFLRERANPTTGVAASRVDPIAVYVNGVRRGGTSELQRIRATQVEEIRYVRPADAQTRYGLGHSSGVIEVVLHGGG